VGQSGHFRLAGDDALAARAGRAAHAGRAGGGLRIRVETGGPEAREANRESAFAWNGAATTLRRICKSCKSFPLLGGGGCQVHSMVEFRSVVGTRLDDFLCLSEFRRPVLKKWNCGVALSLSSAFGGGG
jgi:hypothetical protein